MTGVLLIVALTAFTGVLQVEAKSQSSYLREVLQHFNETRNNLVNPAAKTRARDYIIKTFKDLGLVTWTEEFVSNQGEHPGINVVGQLIGRNAGTAQDKILLIGTHYDSVQTTPGVDDNGSGMTAMLTAIKQILTSDKLRCTRDFTLYVVAFDLEENQSGSCGGGQCACDGISCGSSYFVQNFTKFLNSTGAAFQGALVMDTIMNYNRSEDSQTLPQGLNVAFPNVHKTISDNKFRGDFLTAVGRESDYEKLLLSFTQAFRNDDDIKLMDITLPFSGRPSDQNPVVQQSIGDFLRSDHTRFWNRDLSSIFLTDTANFRGHMTSCYHKSCDDLSKVTDEMVTFLGRTTDALVRVASSMTGENCTMKKTGDQNSGSVDLLGASGEFTSPYYPDLYPNKASFVWEIIVDDDRAGLELSFEEFQVESSANCDADFLMVYDGKYVESSKLLGRYCGTNSPGTIKASGKSLLVKFISDDFDAYKGFKATWATKDVKSGAGIPAGTTWSLTGLLVAIFVITC